PTTLFVSLNAPINGSSPTFAYELAVNGKLTAIDRQTGELLWTQPVEELYMNPYFPPEWPVLVLAARVHSQERPGTTDHVRAILSRSSGELLGRFMGDRDPNNYITWDVHRDQ